MSPRTKALTVRHVFGRKGLLSQWHPQYEYRSGQLAMAEAVEEALRDRRHLIVEAGTGTGKTLAYLVPAILSGRRVVVSTGTKNLQEQLFYKDLPFLQRHFDRPLRVTYMKGRGNYLCRQKLYAVQNEPILSGLEEVADFQIVQDWEKTTGTGDRAEVKTLPESSTAWFKLDARRDLCSGQKCAQFERCFITQMHQRAHESDIIIVNHHLFFADLAMRDDEFGQIIPDYAAVIFDEAHEVEDIAGQYFGVGVSNLQVMELRRDVATVARRKEFGSADLDRALISLEDTTDLFFNELAGPEGRSSVADPRAVAVEHQEAYQRLRESLRLLETQLQLVRGATDEVLPLHRRTKEVGEKLGFWLRGEESRFVYHTERRGRGVFLQATPIDVSSLLTERLFSTLDTVVLTSATLAVKGNFEFLEQRLGLQGARTLLVPGHFDYPSQALLYVPQHLPDPRSAEWLAPAVREIVQLLDISQGRAFVLFTSFHQMRAAYNKVSLAVRYPVLLQGTAPRNALLEEFRETPNCVLFATSSFWQGVDVPGDQLSCVIIDKLPFAPPNDPVVLARSEAIKQAGGNAFYEYQLPQAAIALKQGFGRLIRSRTDRGILALLDNRITRQRYGQVFFDSLPEYSFTMDIDKVREFLPA